MQGIQTDSNTSCSATEKKAFCGRQRARVGSHSESTRQSNGLGRYQVVLTVNYKKAEKAGLTRRVVRLGMGSDANPQRNLRRARRRLSHLNPFPHSPRIVTSHHSFAVSLPSSPSPHNFSPSHSRPRICPRYKFASSTFSLSLRRPPVGILYSCCLASSSHQIPMVT